MSEFVLVVDDDPTICRTLRINLRARGHEVETVGSGRDALSTFADRTPDLVILDLGLPDLDGVDVLREIRRLGTTPVIVLSARRDSDDKVEALDEGADDYVTKPFGMDELMARVRAAQRRSGPHEDSPRIHLGDLIVDLSSKTVTPPAGDPIRLTPTEWSLLELLIRNPGKLMTQRDLLTRVWGPDHPRDNDYLRVYLARLRRKLEPVPSRPRYLITEPGMGYRYQ